MKLTVEDVGQLFRVPEKTIHRWIKSEQLPAYRINSQYRFNPTDLLEWASQHQVDVSPELLQQKELAQGGWRLAEALQSGGIFYDVEGSDKQSVLRGVVERMHVPQRVNSQLLLEVLLAREEMGSTAIGEGIAIPHPRTPIVLNVPGPLVTLAFLKQPIDFDALDGQPVSILFTMICPTTNSHLHLLSRLMFCLRDAQLRKLLIHRASSAEILAGVRSVESTLKDAVAVSPRD